jgi:DNA-binding transcriptional ArsR family regulator
LPKASGGAGAAEAALKLAFLLAATLLAASSAARAGDDSAFWEVAQMRGITIPGTWILEGDAEGDGSDLGVCVTSYDAPVPAANAEHCAGVGTVSGMLVFAQGPAHAAGDVAQAVRAPSDEVAGGTSLGSAPGLAKVWIHPGPGARNAAGAPPRPTPSREEPAADARDDHVEVFLFNIVEPGPGSGSPTVELPREGEALASLLIHVDDAVDFDAAASVTLPSSGGRSGQGTAAWDLGDASPSALGQGASAGEVEEAGPFGVALAPGVAAAGGDGQASPGRIASPRPLAHASAYAPVQGAGAWAAALGLAGALLLGWLYTRLAPDPLEHPIRGSIYANLRQRDGATAAELARLHGIHLTTTLHHLRRLEARGLVGARTAGSLTFWSATGASADTGRLAATRTPAARRLRDAVATRAGCTLADAARAAGMPRNSALYHLRRLEAAGVVRREGSGRGARWMAVAASENA